MAITTAFKRASGLAQDLEGKLNRRYKRRKAAYKSILGSDYTPVQKSLYLAYPNGKAASEMATQIEWNSAMLAALEHDDVMCQFGTDRRWRCWAINKPVNVNAGIYCFVEHSNGGAILAKELWVINESTLECTLLDGSLTFTPAVMKAAYSSLHDDVLVISSGVGGQNLKSYKNSWADCSPVYQANQFLALWTRAPLWWNPLTDHLYDWGNTSLPIKFTSGGGSIIGTRPPAPYRAVASTSYPGGCWDADNDRYWTIWWGSVAPDYNPNGFLWNFMTSPDFDTWSYQGGFYPDGTSQIWTRGGAGIAMAWGNGILYATLADTVQDIIVSVSGSSVSKICNGVPTGYGSANYLIYARVANTLWSFSPHRIPSDSETNPHRLIGGSLVETDVSDIYQSYTDTYFRAIVYAPLGLV